MWNKLKNYWLLYTVVTVIVGGGITKIVQFELWAADVKQKMSTIEKIQVKQATLEDKMFEFIINLWKIEPEQANKWKKIPQETKVTVVDNDTTYSDYAEFEGFDRLLMYHFAKDSLGKNILYVDTLFEYEGSE